jgi:hypothetical protein
MTIDYNDPDIKGDYLTIPQGKIVKIKVVGEAMKEIRTSQNTGKKYPAWIIQVIPEGEELPLKISVLSKAYRELLKAFDNPNTLVGKFLSATHEVIEGIHTYTYKAWGGK